MFQTTRKHLLSLRYSRILSTITSETVASKGIKPFNSIPNVPFTNPITKNLSLLMEYKDDTKGLDINKFFVDINRNHGDAVLVQLPGRNQLLFFDDFLQVFKTEGKYPSGSATTFWPLIRFHEIQGSVDPFLLEGETWRYTRHNLQPYLFSPKAVKEQSDYVNKAMQPLSKAFPEYSTDMVSFCKYAAFDMFFALSVGKQFDSTNKDNNNSFASSLIAAASNAFQDAGVLSRNHGYLEHLPHFMLQIHPLFRRFEKNMLKARSMSHEMIDTVDMEEHGIVQHLMRTGDFDDEQTFAVLSGLLVAGVDTTRYALLNILLTLAENPDKQQKLREELKQVLNGKDYDTSLKYPYLRAVLHESSRLYPLTPYNLRKLKQDLSICGYNVPAGTVVNMSTLKYSQSEEFTGPHPDKFLPERYLPDAVKARKGTKQEIIDHPTVRLPFSFGARMCIGARIAEMELRSAIARIVQDYEFEIDPTSDPYGHSIEFMYVAAPYPKFNIRPID